MVAVGHLRTVWNKGIGLGSYNIECVPYLYIVELSEAAIYIQICILISLWGVSFVCKNAKFRYNL